MPDEPFASLQELLAGQYLLERELGRGGMGVVYLAREARLDRAVAVKVLPRELGANPGLRERFLREARTAAQLSHPNIVPILRADEVGGFAFFTMAFIEGESLADRLRSRGPLAPAEAVRVLRDAAWALAYAHARGVVHRDVKPENIMIERGSNRAVVTDFGIAREQRATSLTQEGMVLGSVHYMSPAHADRHRFVAWRTESSPATRYWQPVAPVFALARLSGRDTSAALRPPRSNEPRRTLPSGHCTLR